MRSRSERRLDQLEAKDQQQAVMSSGNQRFELLPADFAEEEWTVLHAVVWQLNAGSADCSALQGTLTTLSPRELALWKKATSIVRDGAGPSKTTGRAATEAGQFEGADRPRFSASQRSGRSPILVVTEEQSDQLQAGTLRSPSYVRVLIEDNGRDQHRHLRRELEWLICASAARSVQDGA